MIPLVRLALYAWTLGSTQLAYIVLGPCALAYALYHTAAAPFRKEKPSLGSCWEPFAALTISLVPVLGAFGLIQFYNIK
jgi:hypothetical protein